MTAVRNVLAVTVALCSTAYILYTRRHGYILRLGSVEILSNRNISSIITDHPCKTLLSIDQYTLEAETNLLSRVVEGPSLKQELADLYFFGSKQVAPNYRKAFELYSQTYEETGSTAAAHMLSLYYSEGLGIPPDPARALTLNSIAAKSGHLPAHLTAAYWYSAGLHVPTDCSVARSHYFEVAKVVDEELKGRKRKYRSIVPPESLVDRKKRGDVMALFPSQQLIEYYKYSADKGQIESQTILGQVYYHGGADWDPDYSTALKYFQSASNQGGAIAQGYIGQMYLRGEGVEQSDRLAYLYFKSSAEGGSAMGLNGMGMCYWKGLEVMQDYDEAWEFFDKAIAKDHVESLFNVAMMLKEWNETLYTENILSYLIRAVKNGHVLSHYELAKFYGHKQGFCSLAIYLLKTFVEKGDASYLLDQAHGHYQDGRINQATSRYLFMAGQGFEVAQSNLAFILNSYDPERALIWWNRSSLQDNFKSRLKVGDYFYERFPSKSLGQSAAAAYYISSALHKDAMANYKMGWLYGLGQGVSQDVRHSTSFFADSVKYDPKGSIAVSLAQKYLTVMGNARRYRTVLLILVPLWLTVFAGLIGLILMWGWLEGVPMPDNNHNRNAYRRNAAITDNVQNNQVQGE